MRGGYNRPISTPHSLIGRVFMGRINPGDKISIKFPERNSLVKAGKLVLKVPDSISAVVPNTITKKELGLLERLVDWDILLVNEIPSQPSLEEMDSLDEELLFEYGALKSKEAISFISKLSEKRRFKFLDYERYHKKRKTVLKAFEQC